MKYAKFACIPIMLMMFLGFTGCGNKSAHTENITAQNGVIDLSEWKFSSDGNVKLDGEWAFYWDKLIAPGEFGSAVEPTGYYSVPGYWTHYRDLNLPSKGLATYRLIIKTNGNTNNLSIRAPEIYTEYSLWINGKLVEATGSFADRSLIYMHPAIYNFSTDGTDVEIVLQVKNAVHVYGGIRRSFLLGTTCQIYSERNTNAALDLILFAICLSAGIYHLVLYLFRKKDRELLFFGILCLAICIRTLLSNETLLMQAFQALPFWVGSRVFTLTVPLCVSALLCYTRALFKDDTPKMLSNILLSISALYALIVLLVSPYIYSAIFLIFSLVVAAILVLCMYVSVRTLIKKRPEASQYFMGMLFFSFGAFIDCLIFWQWIDREYILPAGLSVFIITQAVLLAKRYSDAFRNIEQLSESLKASSDKIINTETAFLNAQIKPHFLYNTLNIIAEYCETDPQKAGKLIVSLSKYLRGTLDFENLGGIIPLKKELELVRAYVSIEKARFEDVDVEFDMPDPLPDILLPPLTIQPLVENAIKHGLRKREGEGFVKIKASATDGGVLFSVEDNGIGITENSPSSLMDTPKGSASIGLYNINARLVNLYGNGLTIRSTVNVGTTVSFEIPTREGA